MLLKCRSLFHCRTISPTIYMTTRLGVGCQVYCQGFNQAIVKPDLFPGSLAGSPYEYLARQVVAGLTTVTCWLLILLASDQVFLSPYSGTQYVPICFASNPPKRQVEGSPFEHGMGEDPSTLEATTKFLFSHQVTWF